MTAFAPPELRCTPMGGDSTLAAISSDAPSLKALKETVPDLKIFTQSNEHYQKVMAVWNSDLAGHQPLAVCRPTSTAQVAAVVTFATANKVPIAARAGGHDVWGRSRPTGALVIDLRELDTIELAENRKTITIGGGVIAGNVYSFLAQHKLIAATGGCTSVGYANWSMIGGYNTLSGTYGQGVDQIEGATLVTATGAVEQADDETLWGVRGAGGNFGIATALQLKVYESSGVLAGVLAWPADAAPAVMKNYSELLARDFPDAYSATCAGGAVPGMGKVLLIIFVWGSTDHDAGRAFLERVLAGNPPPMANTVGVTTMPELLAGVPMAYGINTSIRSACVESLTPTFVHLWLERVAAVPDDSGCLSTLHFVHGAGARPNPGSCVSRRDAHVLVEIVCMSAPEGDKRPGYAWVDDTFRALKASPEALSGGYLALMGLDEPVKESYAGNWERLVALKRKKDPTNVFRWATPELLTP